MLTYWVAGGIVLALLEIVVPGLVLIFLGIAALIVAGAIYVGLIDHWMTAFTAWFVISLLSLVVLRGAFQRLMPGDEDWSSTDEDADAFGKIVEVTETIEKGKQGRISFRGTTWAATCYDHTLAAGRKARLVYRENVVWVVEPAGEPTEQFE